MFYLYLDTTHYVVLGLYSEDKNQWIEYRELKEKRSSLVVHSLILKILSLHNLKFKNIIGLIMTSGPGSYTGMRVAQGIANILQWQKKKIISFYHFQIPYIVGVKEGTWIAKAFKREIFEYTWNEKATKQTLYSEKDFVFKRTNNIYTHFLEKFETPLLLTSDLIKKNSSEIFPFLIKNEFKQNLFYYRSLEKEFTRSQS